MSRKDLTQKSTDPRQKANTAGTHGIERLVEHISEERTSSQMRKILLQSCDKETQSDVVNLSIEQLVQMHDQEKLFTSENTFTTDPGGHLLSENG
jgi:hypothetical protein